MEEARRTMAGMILGIIIWFGIISMGGIFIADAPLKFFFGEIVGTATAIGLMFHLYHSLDTCLDMDEERASKYGKGMALVRGVLTLLVLIAVCLLRTYISPFGAIFGLFGRKLAVYLQPGLQILLKKLKRKEMKELGGE